ncbi:MAG: hypothetical protein LBJ67_04120 [Planctomycetaceae bacterium]|nr:hypothetical protein [Planctomycetaceae bacterium]
MRPKTSEQLICEWLVNAKHTGGQSAITEGQRALILACHASRRKNATRTEEDFAKNRESIFL